MPSNRCWRTVGDHSTKVLDVIWTDGTMPLIVAYHAGTWEEAVAVAADRKRQH